MSSSARLGRVTCREGSPCTPAGTGAPASVSTVGMTSSGCTGVSIRPRGRSAPGYFTTIGTCSSGSYSIRPMCPTKPCSPSSSPWSAVTMMSAFS